MYLIHETTLENLKIILQDGVLKSSCKSGRVRYGENEGCLNEIYMSVVFPDGVKPPQKGGIVDILLIFDANIMKKYMVSHWNPQWDYGHVSPESILYDTSKTPEENIKSWASTFDVKSRAANQEVVFMEDEIPLKGNLVGIFYTKKTGKDKIPLLIDTKQELTKLLFKK